MSKIYSSLQPSSLYLSILPHNGHWRNTNSWGGERGEGIRKITKMQKIAAGGFPNKLHLCEIFPRVTGSPSASENHEACRLLVHVKSPRLILVLRLPHTRRCLVVVGNGFVVLCPRGPSYLWLIAVRWGSVASWSPASLPKKEVDYFGSKNLFFSLLHARLAAEVLWTFPSFFFFCCCCFSAQSCAFSFMVHFLCFDLLVVTPTLAYKIAGCRASSLYNLPGDASGRRLCFFLPATLVFLLCCKGTTISLLERVWCMWRGRKKEQGRKMEGENRRRGVGRRDREKKTGTGWGEYSLLYSVENIILFKLRLSCEVSGHNASLPYLGIFCF